jgi:hypothetical protein
MSNKGNAYALATVLYARDTKLTIEELSDNIYHVVDVLEFGEDERKADLYAQLEENLTASLPFSQAVEIIEAAMDNTDRRFK